MVNLSGCIGILIGTGEYTDSVSDMTIRDEPTVKKEKEPSTHQQQQQRGSPCQIGKTRKNSFERFQGIAWLD